MKKVIYISHDGFAVELDDVLLVFDDVHDPAHVVEKILKHNPAMPVVYFISHKLYNNHHFNPGMFERTQERRCVYVVSNSVPAMTIPSTLDVAGMSRGDYIEDLPGGITVRAYEATKGVSFLVTTKEGDKIFHAGDLNDWLTPSDASESEARQARERYQTIVNRIAAENPSVDIAMLSVNPRLGDDCAEGARIFTEAVDVKHFFPMDVDGEAKQACDFSYLPERTKGHCLTSPGEKVNI